jgi:ribonuclease J
MNIDGLVSVYRAARHSRRRLYMDDYQAQIALATGNPHIPNPNAFADVFAFTPRVIAGERYERLVALTNRQSTPKIALESNYVMLIRQSMLPLLQRLNASKPLVGATLIFALWAGYKVKPEMKTFLEACAGMGINLVDLHVSGHADDDALQRLKRTVGAKEVITVHTNTEKEK